MRHNPRAGDVKTLEHARAGYRRRVGNWRIFFDLYEEQRLIDVVLIERRTSTTYRKR
jgi:mRNA-degrading endonuclease RelE of RelBE toxin-antitoxin system